MKAFFGIFLGLVGLLMSSCGGVFFVGSLGSSSGGYASGIRMIAGFFLLVGALILWAGISLWRSWKRQSTDSAAPNEPT